MTEIAQHHIGYSAADQHSRANDSKSQPYAAVTAESSKKMHTHNVEQSLDFNWIFGRYSVEFPKDITPGEYCVIDNSGNVPLLVVTDLDLSYFGITTELLSHALYVLTVRGRRWYFICVDATRGKIDATVSQNTTVVEDIRLGVFHELTDSPTH